MIKQKNIKEDKKLSQEEALAKIKALISSHFENVGREMFEDADLERRELIDDIDDVLNQTDISVKHLIIEKLELDELKGRLERR